MTTTIVVGNPRPRSRTYAAAVDVAERLSGSEPDHRYDLVEFGADLLDWNSDRVAQAVEVVCASRLLVVASPTFKTSYSGLLKLFLDRFAADSLGGAVVVPLMLGGHAQHSLAPDVFLAPVLRHLGAGVLTPGLFLLDSQPLVPDEWINSCRSVLDSWSAVGRTEAR